MISINPHRLVWIKYFCFVVLAMMILGCRATGQGLVWQDEFDGSALNPANWKAYNGDGCPNLCGFGNNELQHYSDRPENLKVENGKLIITALKDSLGNRAYSSAKLVTKNLASWKYGRIEVRAKLPAGKGTWPAIWMLPERRSYGGWPASGEIDIMEHVGFNQGVVYGTVHTGSFNHMIGTQKMDSLVVADASTAFHVYSIEWKRDRIDWYIDDQLYHTFENTRKNSDDWPFDRPFHLILNVAVGGNWGGKYGVDDSIWPQSMEVDYVRVYAF